MRCRCRSSVRPQASRCPRSPAQRSLASTDGRMRLGIPVTAPARTLVDLAARLKPRELEAAINEADRLDLIDPTRLRQAIDGMRSQPGAGTVLRLLDRQDFLLTDSELERRFLRLGTVGASVLCRRPGRTSRASSVDFFWRELGLIVETDGLRYHRTPSQQARDRRRDQAAHRRRADDICGSRTRRSRFEPAEVRRCPGASGRQARRAAGPPPSLQRMCGRYTLTDPDPRLLRFRFGLDRGGEDRAGAQVQRGADRSGARGQAEWRRGARARRSAVGADPALRQSRFTSIGS